MAKFHKPIAPYSHSVEIVSVSCICTLVLGKNYVVIRLELRF